MASAAWGGTVVITGLTTGPEVRLSLLPMLADQIKLCGSIMGTLHDMKCMMGVICWRGNNAQRLVRSFLWTAPAKASGRCGQVRRTERRSHPVKFPGPPAKSPAYCPL
jgi:hypothetical protein